MERQVGWGILVAAQVADVPPFDHAQVQLNEPSLPSESTDVALPDEQRPAHGYAGVDEPLAVQQLPLTAGRLDTLEELDPSVSAQVALVDVGFLMRPATEPDVEG